LEKYDFDFSRLVNENRETTLGYGSEFRPLTQLRRILGQHPNFSELEKIISHGMDYRFATDLPERERETELAGITERGNHQSAVNRTVHVAKALTKDVIHGFSMPILQETVPRLKGAMAQPLGMAEQLALTESGERVPKFRLTQDLSFSLTGEKISVNDRVDMDEYVEMIYGWCLPRTIHYIVA
jgi:hypothetical protein